MSALHDVQSKERPVEPMPAPRTTGVLEWAQPNLRQRLVADEGWDPGPEAEPWERALYELGALSGEAWYDLHGEARAFTDEERRFMARCAQVAVDCVRRVGLVDAQQRVQEIVDGLPQVATQPAAVQSAYLDLTEVIRAALDADHCCLMLRDDARHVLRVQACSGSHSDVGREVPLGTCEVESPLAEIFGRRVLSELLENERPCVVSVDDADEELRRHLQARGLRALMGVRLGGTGQPRGVLYLGLAHLPPPHANHQLQTLARRVDAGIRVVRLLQEDAALIEEHRRQQHLHRQVISEMVHDLRGPLQATYACMDILSRHAVLPDDLRPLMGMAEETLQRAERMLNALLDAAREANSRRPPPRLEPCNLMQVCRGVINELQAQWGDRIQLRADVEPEGIWCGDELRSVAWNLITNALKYGLPHTPVKVELRVMERGPELRVHNQGSPLTEEEKRLLFVPFERALQAARREQPGWGLGLAAVRECAERHRGTVQVESDHNVGTTFIFSLPWDSRS